MRTFFRFLFILPFFIFCFCKIAIAQCWNNGDLTTYGQAEYGASTGTAMTLLVNKYNNVYSSGIFEVGDISTYYLEFDAGTAVHNYLPQTGPIGALDGILFDPTDSHSGIFGGDVVALKLNVDFSDAGLLPSNSGLKFGDLVIVGLTSNTSLNGATLRQLLSTANTALSGASTPYTIADLHDIVTQINASFDSGTPSSWAQQHLRKGWQNGDLTTYGQSQWAINSPSTLLLNNYNSVYASTGGLFIVGSHFIIQFDGAQAVLDYLPQSGAVGVLNGNLDDPASSASGSFGGDVVSLKLDIDFSDAGLLTANSGLKFGDLVLYGFTTADDLNGALTQAQADALNGKTVRQVFDELNNVLGGNGETYGLAVSQLDYLASQLTASFAIATVGPSPFAQLHLKRGWQNGDLYTNIQSSWGSGGSANSLLTNHYNSIYFSVSGLFVIGDASKYDEEFETSNALSVYLPQTGAAGVLTTSLVNPTNSGSGSFGGNVAALKLNIDFSDSGYLAASSGIKFGDLVLCNNTGTLTGLNGMTLRQFLATANKVLGAVSNDYSAGDLDGVANLLNASFVGGTPSSWAQLHLVNGSCDCGNTVTNHCPTAGAIDVSTTVGTDVKFLLQGTDADNNTLTYSISQTPSHGTAVVAGGDSIIYTPAAGYYGNDQLKYKASDGNCSAEATVNITIIVCPGGSGYWKGHPEAWPVSSLLLGTISYSKSQLITILNTPVGTGNNADASLILADQLIPGKLSLANGAPAVDHLSDSIAAADALIGSSLIPMKVKPNSALGKKMTSLAVFFSNYNNGLLTQGCQSLITRSKTEAEVKPIAGGYTLEQNYPNPFDHSTVIHYLLPVTNRVQLKLFDASGRMITTLVDRTEDAGYKTVWFDAGNLSTGVYYYQLNAENFAEVKKMILVK